MVRYYNFKYTPLLIIASAQAAALLLVQVPKCSHAFTFTSSTPRTKSSPRAKPLHVQQLQLQVPPLLPIGSLRTKINSSSNIINNNISFRRSVALQSSTSSSSSSSSKSSDTDLDVELLDADLDDDIEYGQICVEDDQENKRSEFTTLPRHETNKDINDILTKTETAILKLYENSIEIECTKNSEDCIEEDEMNDNDIAQVEKVYANSYVDLGKVDTVGFDYDYTLVTYKDELLDLIYDMTLNRLVKDYEYPLEMLDPQSNLKFDPYFSIRGLAVDRETAWICHLSYTHKVAVAYEGRKKVSRERLMKEYRGKRSLKPDERKKRLKPLNDLFSMAECCLIADVVQFFHDHDIPFCPKNAVVDILDAIGRTHISGDFHRLVSKIS